jgi:hypothetical protein
VLKEILTVKVTKIKNKYHCRLYEKEKVFDEMACKNKSDISFCISTMLRWYDKLGGTSKMASSSRARQLKKSTITTGKIWYKKDLEI